MTDIIERLLDEQEDEHHQRFEPPDVSCGRLPYKRSVSQGDVLRNTGSRVWSSLRDPTRLAPGTSDPLKETGETAAHSAETAGREPDERQTLNNVLYVTRTGGMEYGIERPVQRGDWEKIEESFEATSKESAETDGRDGDTASLTDITPQSVIYDLQRAVIPRVERTWYGERHPILGKTLPTSPLTVPDRTGQASAAALYQRLRRTGEAAQYRGQGESGAGILPTMLHTDTVSLSELDRAFQRDARRYDSGFELY